MLLSGCKYTFTEEYEIEEQILKVTPLGITSAEARNIADEQFGKASYWMHGPAEKRYEGWVTTGSFHEKHRRNVGEPYYFTYKIGSHPSSAIILPTYVFAHWFFNDSDHLVHIEVLKVVDAI